MQDTYTLDLSAFTLEKLKNVLQSARLLPSQKILGENIDQRFALLRQHGIENLQQLQDALKTKPALAAFARQTGLPADYLTILRREVNSYQPQPVDLKNFPGVELDAIEKLAQLGIRNTRQLFAHVLTPQSRQELAGRSGIECAALLELTRLTDVARMKWVGPKFARLLLEAGYGSVEKVATADADRLYHDITRTNAERGIYQGGLGLEDIRLWINFTVQDVPRVIVYD
ncbi:MAG: DUF4332 domain-containing protein [Chloroflexota bacterium]